MRNIGEQLRKIKEHRENSSKEDLIMRNNKEHGGTLRNIEKH
jgi:hypothetical protein